MSKNITPVLVLTLYCDETQLPKQIQTLEQQSYSGIYHQVISGLGAIAAEQAIYKACQATSCGLIIKLDADMTLTNTHVIESITTWFDVNKEMNRITIPVRDFFTGTFVIGVHAWRRGSVPQNVEIKAPNPDSWISKINGAIFYGLAENMVDHGINPGASQAIRFGLHRGLKARLGGAKHQHWITLCHLQTHWQKHRKQWPSLSHAFLGALIGIGSIKIEEEINFESINYHGKSFKSILDYCLDQERKSFSILEDGRHDVISRNLTLFRDRASIYYLKIKMLRKYYLICRDRWITDEISVLLKDRGKQIAQ